MITIEITLKNGATLHIKHADSAYYSEEDGLYRIFNDLHDMEVSSDGDISCVEIEETFICVSIEEISIISFRS